VDLEPFHVGGETLFQPLAAKAICIEAIPISPVPAVRGLFENTDNALYGFRLENPAEMPIKISENTERVTYQIKVLDVEDRLYKRLSVCNVDQ